MQTNLDGADNSGARKFSASRSSVVHTASDVPVGDIIVVSGQRPCRVAV
nr:hypothetical protein [Roseicyclus sp.]